MSSKNKLLLLLVVVCEFQFDVFTEAKRSNSSLKQMKNGNNFNKSSLDESEKIILDMFGFKRRPTPPENVHIPRIMKHLYKAHMGDYFENQESLKNVWEKGFDLPPDDVISRVNTARSFHHIDQDEHFPGIANHQVRLRFNLSTVPDKEVIGASDLLLHREAIADHIKGSFNRINVYEIVKLPQDHSIIGSSLDGKWKSLSQGPFASGAITRLLDTRLVNTRNSTWEKFDVSLATRSWTNNKEKDNHGLLVEVVADDSEQAPSTQEEKKHVRLKRDLHQELDDREWQDKRPTLVTYSHDGKKTNLRRRSRSKRNSKRKDSNSSRRKKKRRRRRPCARHNLYVDFSEVGWHEWIVAPHGYDAFYCQGQCQFPLAEHMNATNHAIVQTLTNSVNPMLIPNPCCVPTELSSISMLYIDEHNLVVLKSYPNMAVEACGCR